MDTQTRPRSPATHTFRAREPLWRPFRELCDLMGVPWSSMLRGLILRAVEEGKTSGTARERMLADAKRVDMPEWAKNRA